MLTVLDVNNFWSPTGGGVRRYELEKARVLGEREGVRFVFALPGKTSTSERISDNVVFEHIGDSLPSRGQYRNIVISRGLRRVVERHRPDVIECGSPIFLPPLVQRASAKLEPRPALVGFWHADFPRTYTGLGMRLIHPALEPAGERLGWRWMRRAFRKFDGIFVASRWVGRNLMRNGLDRLYYTPLGVDSETFTPARRDPELVERFRGGHPDRKILFFPHRFSEEKGLRNLLSAYATLRERVTPEPALVFAGTGPEQARVEDAVAANEHVHFVGYLDSRELLARHFASCDICPCLSKFETFGLSTAEALAAGLAVVAADEGSAGELVEDCGGGLTVPYNDSAALADAIVTLVEDGQLDERGRRGRAYAQQLTWDATFDRELRFYREIVARKRGGQPPATGFHGADSLSRK
ncbi:GDP-mannose-dependent alpha-mannosyltransferase [Enhygromyxa salina]|uniref:GDP-mannose-dependent alpha-mannosyltransferase n=1 Tax=Enhygromyxa salina TaxID=215803 RepID=A0A2S9YJN0_9BACT|nr:GDP-mannose-dependent alpha-mannosyltransferase [Enhygromyxa salina]